MNRGDKLAKDLERLEQAYVDSLFRVAQRDCKRHDFSRSDICRRCGYHEPFVYRP